MPCHFSHFSLEGSPFVHHILYTFLDDYPEWTVMNILVNSRDKNTVFDYNFYIAIMVSD